MLLKVVLFAYSQSIISSRDIEAVCRDHVTFIALSGDTQPHFTTIAGFVSNLADDIARVFTQILYLKWSKWGHKNEVRHHFPTQSGKSCHITLTFNSINRV